MKISPLVSVIIPTYKRATYLTRAIESVLNQQYSNIEVIVVDDNDTNTEFRLETEEKMKQYKDDVKVKYIKHEKNKNGAAARNTGISNSKGEYITFLDDDDIFTVDRVSKIVSEMEKPTNEEFGAAYTNIKLISHNGVKNLNDEKKCKSGNFKRELLLGKFSIGSGSNIFLRKDIVTKIGEFDVSFKRHQDLEYLIRFFRISKLLYVDEILATKYTDSPINIPNSYVFEEVKQHYLNVFRKDIEGYTKKEQEEIYAFHAYELSLKYIKDLRVKDAYKLVNKYINYISFKERVELFKVYTKSVIKAILKFMKLRK